MATNVYFSPKVRSEQNLYEDIIIESLKMFGQDVLYIPREVIKEDEILNEDYSRFTDAYGVEMYIENTDNFAGEGDLMSKFGLQIRDQATFICSKKRWEHLVSLWNNDVGIDRPAEGDLIYLPLSNSMFQISHVEHEQPFYALGNLPTYKLNCELFEYSSQEINTGVIEVDQFETKYSDYAVFGINTGTVGNFQVHETVRQATGLVDSNNDPIFVTGEVSKVEYPAAITEGVIYINDSTGTDGIYRQFVISSTVPIIGQTTGASWMIYADVSTMSLSDKEQHINDPWDKGREFETYSVRKDSQGVTTSDSIIDFSESNPFGEP
jgi:hypothetical protein